MIIKYLEVTQPIGTFYLSSMPADDLDRIVDVRRRLDEVHGVQRELSSKRVDEISEFCSDPDAVFPSNYCKRL